VTSVAGSCKDSVSPHHSTERKVGGGGEFVNGVWKGSGRGLFYGITLTEHASKDAQVRRIFRSVTGRYVAPRVRHMTAVCIRELRTADLSVRKRSKIFRAGCSTINTKGPPADVPAPRLPGKCVYLTTVNLLFRL
jgi:hypothetical protein